MPDAHFFGRAATFALGVFLLLFGGLVAARGPDRATRGLLGAYLGLVGLNFLLDSGLSLLETPLRHAGPVRHLVLVAAILDPPVLLLFALSLARGGLTPTRVALVLAPALLLLGLYAAAPPEHPFMASWRFRFAYLVHLAPCYGLAFVLVAERYLAERDPALREPLGLLLVVAGLIALPRIPLLAIDAGVWRLVAPEPFGRALFMLGLGAGTLLLHGAFLAHVRARNPHARPGGTHARPFAALGFLLGLVALAWAAASFSFLTGALFPLLYSFRWLLVAAVLGMGLRDHTLQGPSARIRDLARRALLATLFLVGVLHGAAFLASLGVATPLAASACAAGVLLLARLAFRRAFPGPADETAWRRANLYRAMLERDLPERELAHARRRWRISREQDRELRDLLAAERSLARAASSAAPLAPGALALGRYEVLRLLGAGGSGRAFLAWDRVRRERVVLKEPHGPDEEGAWAAEAEALARVDSPHVARLRALERAPTGPLLVLDHVEGETLRARLAHGALPPDELDRLARGLLSGLAALHRAGLVHRDVKPENVLLGVDGSPVLVDLGLARPREGDTLRVPLLAGTPAYASPEQARGEPVGPAADVHAAGRVLWEAGGAREPLWRDALQRAMDPDPARRWRDAEAFRLGLAPLAPTRRAPLVAERRP